MDEGPSDVLRSQGTCFPRDFPLVTLTLRLGQVLAGCLCGWWSLCPWSRRVPWGRGLSPASLGVPKELGSRPQEREQLCGGDSPLST